jgi:hypothetical protein
MKTIYYTILIVFTLAYNDLYAQNNSEMIFQNQDSLAIQLNKSGIDMLKFNENDPCNPRQFGKIMFGNFNLPKKEKIINPELITGDTTNQNFNKSDKYTNIYWVHGLNGSSDTWKMPALCTEYGDIELGFPARKANSIIFTGNGNGNQTYTEAFGIDVASMDLAHQADHSQIDHTEYDFIIAHSQGGIVARDWLRKIDNDPNHYQNDVHGLVTFGTPHLGAQIINETRSNLKNRAKPFLIDACKALSSPMIHEQVNSNFITRLLLSSDNISKILDATCSGLTNTILPFALQGFEKPTTEDFYVGSPFLTGYTKSNVKIEGLSEHKLNVPFVQFFGIEDEPVFWRYVSSIQRMDEDNDAETSKKFAYDDDDALIEKVSLLINDFQSKYNGALDKYLDDAKYYGVYEFLRMASLNIYKNKSLKDGEELLYSYDCAINWLNNANEYYKNCIVGAMVLKQTNYYCMSEVVDICLNQQAIERNQYSSSKVSATSANICPQISTSSQYTTTDKDGYWRCTHMDNKYVAYENIYEYKESDGVVLAESAGGTILYDPIKSYIKIPLQSSNHFQMVNSKVTKQELIKLYDGDYGNIFKVGKR